MLKESRQRKAPLYRRGGVLRVFLVYEIVLPKILFLSTSQDNGLF
jgi:hypothetical protein